MSYQIRIITDVLPEDEPVTLAMQKAWSRIDDDYAMDDQQLLAQITAARELLEQHTNIGMAVKKLELQWYGDKIELPFSPTGDIISVTKADGTVLTTDEYYEDSFQAKSIGIKGCHTVAGNWFYSEIFGTAEFTPLIPEYGIEREVYKCVYETGYSENIPVSLKNAIMTQADYTIKNFGMPTNEIVSTEALRMANKYSRNLVL